jgi:hypothetical protein
MEIFSGPLQAFRIVLAKCLRSFGADEKDEKKIIDIFVYGGMISNTIVAVIFLMDAVHRIIVR